ncbi:hypothetical protein OAX78_01540, partial [Planctomycetota bacterium]|nr:hypothetical protein [Planctomycetota bacterium]
MTHQPLGEDWETLTPADRDIRAVEALSELFAKQLDHGGDPHPDREVLEADLGQIRYRTGDDVSTLRWADVNSIEHQTLEELPSRPETLYVYLAEGSPSLQTVHDLVTPLLASAGLASSHLELESRPRWSRVR